MSYGLSHPVSIKQPISLLKSNRIFGTYVHKILTKVKYIHSVKP